MVSMRSAILRAATMLNLVLLTASMVTPTPPRLVVAGGTGFVGREICREAVNRGWSVTSLSRRGSNPEPGSALDSVDFVAGDAADAAVLDKLTADADAVVHSVGALFDSESGLAQLNRITSGSGSMPADGATYDTLSRDTALALLDAAQKSDDTKALLFVSANEAGWPNLPSSVGRQLEENLPEWLGRYLSAKRDVEQALANQDSIRAIVARPSLMYSPTKFDVLPLLPIWNALSAVNAGGDGVFGKMLPATVVGASAVEALSVALDSEALEAVSDGTAAPKLKRSDMVGAATVLSPARLDELAPLSARRAVGPIDTLTSGLASIARLPWGTTVSEAPLGPPPADGALRLYEFEGCPYCRRVREVVTYLDLVVDIYPCAA